MKPRHLATVIATPVGDMTLNAEDGNLILRIGPAYWDDLTAADLDALAGQFREFSVKLTVAAFHLKQRH